MSSVTRTINGKKYILKKYYDAESLAHAKSEKENAALRGLEVLYDEYIALLLCELNEAVVFANVHGWVSTRREAGKVLRKKIEALKELK